jgi:hypothetical protein
MADPKLYFNLVHRVTGSLTDFKYFKIQVDLAHSLGLKCTNIVGYDALRNAEITDYVKAEAKQHGDRVGLLLTNLDEGDGFSGGNYVFWLYAKEDKKKIALESIEKFKSVFGFVPPVLTTYYMDAPTINFIKSKYPEVEAVFATCFEEGVKMLTGANYSYFLFSEGSPWNPWIPSKDNSFCPAADASEDSGVVAFPHLTRDMLLSVEDRNDYFSSHPMNVTRGWVYEGTNWNYMYNFFDMTVLQAKYNGGYSYTNIYVDPKWIRAANEHDDGIRLQIYTDSLKYMKELKGKGLLVDMDVVEFARWFRQNRGVNKPEVNLWKDVLTGSQKQIFWYNDAAMRATVDPNQNGAIVDLRPYVAKLDRTVGTDSDNLYDGSYPFILHAQYRGGWPSFMDSKSMVSGSLRYDGETRHFRNYRTQCVHQERADGVAVVMDPVDIDFKDVKVQVRTTVIIKKGGAIGIERQILQSSKADAEFEILEYMNGVYGTTEYPTDLRKVRMEASKGQENVSLDVRYTGKTLELPGAEAVTATVPDVSTQITLTTSLKSAKGFIRDATPTSPMYSFGYSGKLKLKEESTTWLKIKKS